MQSYMPGCSSDSLSESEVNNERVSSVSRGMMTEVWLATIGCIKLTEPTLVPVGSFELVNLYILKSETCSLSSHQIRRSSFHSLWPEVELLIPTGDLKIWVFTKVYGSGRIQFEYVGTSVDCDYESVPVVCVKSFERKSVPLVTVCWSSHLFRRRRAEPLLQRNDREICNACI